MPLPTPKCWQPCNRNCKPMAELATIARPYAEAAFGLAREQIGRAHV